MNTARRVRRWIVLALTAVSMGSCRPQGAPVPPDAGSGPALRFKPPGRCFGKPMKCAADSQCGPPFSTCQEGTCCSGTIDPETCACHCGNETCGPDELCCKGGEWSRESRGILKCREIEDCYGPK